MKKRGTQQRRRDIGLQTKAASSAETARKIIVPGFPLGKALVGLIGCAIARSLTPALQEEEARHHGLRLHYQLIDLDRTGSGPGNLPMLLAAVRTIGFDGLNITFPCKQAIVPLLDGLSDEARAIGAVNTVVNRGGWLTGHNTDSSGWRWGFGRSLPGADLSRVVLLGAGGAGCAVGHALCRMGTTQLVIFDEVPGRARALAESLNHGYGPQQAIGVESGADPSDRILADAMANATGLVNATPTGMAGSPGIPLPACLLRPDCWVADVVYYPLETPLLQAARLRGCATVDGGTMAVGQAVGAFELFTGLQADSARMTAHFGRLLEEVS
jgi:shikimate dehydrogenase